MLEEISILERGKRQVCLYVCKECGYERVARRDSVKRYNYACGNCKKIEKRELEKEKEKVKKERKEATFINNYREKESEGVNIEKAKRKQEFREYKGNYLVSDKGRIYKKSTGKYLKGTETYRGDRRISINGKGEYLHRIVAEVFKVEGEGETVNHKNGNPRDNRAVNLEYLTFEENLSHARDIGKTGNKKRGYGVEELKEAVEEIKRIKKEKKVSTKKAASELGYNVKWLMEKCKEEGVCWDIPNKQWRAKSQVESVEEAEKIVLDVTRLRIIEGLTSETACEEVGVSNSLFNKCRKSLGYPEVKTRGDNDIRDNGLIKYCMGEGYTTQEITNFLYKTRQKNEFVINRIQWLKILGEWG